jgi:3-hydroxyisobutyrate dehydrogenase
VKARISFLGVGNMGGRMARRLLGAGYVVTAYDPNPEALAAIVSAGARAVESPLETGREVDVVICSLPSPSIVEEAITGQSGAMHGLDAGATVIDMSTGDPGTAIRMAVVLSAHGINFLDAPVSRGVAGATNGTLAIMVGGDGEVLESRHEILSHLGTDIIHVGPVGCGQMAKLCNNMMAAITMQGLAETLVTGVKAGLDIDILAKVIGMSSGGSWILSNYLPLTILANDDSAKFALDLMHKDVGLFLKATEEMGLSAPLSAICVQTNRLAKNEGYGTRDYSAVISYFAKLADISLVNPQRSQEARAIKGG